MTAPCSHPDDMRCPLSGDDWQCAVCGAYVDEPAGVDVSDEPIDFGDADTEPPR